MFRVLTDLRVLASIALIGGLLAVALWPRAVVVDVARVARGPLVVTIEEQGRTRVRDRFRVAAPVAGRVLRIELEPGDRVTRGDVVARLRPGASPLLDARMQAEASAAIRSAEASLGRARADQQRARVALAHARRNLSRSRDLHASGVAPQADLEARDTHLSIAAEADTAAAFAVRAAAAEVERAKARLAAAAADDAGRIIVVKAPIDGIVLERFHESENVVAAGEPLLDIGDLQRLEIVTDLLSTDAVMVKPGASASVARFGGDVALAATVRRIEPGGFTKTSALGVEEQRVNIVLDFSDNGEDDAPLGDAYRVDARIVLWDAPDVLKLPTSALVRDGHRWAVYIVSAGRARRQVIDVGRHTGQEAEVRSGLTQGTMVVVHPSDLVRDGVRLVTRPER